MEGEQQVKYIAKFDRAGSSRPGLFTSIALENTSLAFIDPAMATHDKALGLAAQAHGLKVLGT
jgi:hypothetical protein